MPVGTNFHSKDTEMTIVREWLQGAKTIDLMKKYGFKTDKSITDKVKKYGFWTRENIKVHRDKTKNYVFKLDYISN